MSDPEALPFASDIAFDWGVRLRRARLRAGRTQAEVGRVAGVATSTVCRMELGRGAGYPLHVWVAVATAVSVTLDARPDLAERYPFGVIELTKLAADAGWTVVDRAAERSTGLGHPVVLERPPQREVVFGRPSIRTGSMVVALVVDVMTDPERLVDDVAARVADIASMAPTGWSVGGVIVVRATASNRRRLRATRAAWSLANPAIASQWIAALTNATSSIPSGTGVVWIARDGRRLTPPWLRLWSRRVA